MLLDLSLYCLSLASASFALDVKIDQQINQSINQSMYGSINHFASQSVNQLESVSS